MPNSEQAKKRMKQDATKRARNLARKRSIFTTEKKFTSAVESNDKVKAVELLTSSYSQLDKAVKVGLIKKNTANRKKSQLKLKLNKLA